MSDIVYQAIIPIHPITKKNNQKIITNRRTNRPMIIQNEKYTTYENQAGWFLRKPKQPIDYPVNIECRFYRKNAVRCDLTNLLEAIDDVLVKYGIIKDDAFTILQSHDGSRVYVDKDKPRTEIIITRGE